MLVAAMNPCPCGYFGSPNRQCTCSRLKVQQYLSRVSGPLLDRLDLHIDVMPVEFEHISSTEKAESSAAIKARVNAARIIQNERFQGTGITCNARITPAKLHEICRLTDKGLSMLKTAFEKLGLSARAYDRILKVSRTIADLDGSEVIGAAHVAEAIPIPQSGPKILGKLRNPRQQGRSPAAGIFIKFSKGTVSASIWIKVTQTDTA